ncbi:MAG TPA: hypothetical protein VGK28_05285 [Candidatus Dormibacteraeota bacterium]|jgi:hypothetical protein
MGSTPQGRGPTTFSPDGFWWWDGAQWRSAVSPDRRWRWNGQAWVPLRPLAPPARGGGAATAAILVTVLAFGGVIVLVAILTLVILLTMGNQLSNVFSNVVAALGATPSP